MKFTKAQLNAQCVREGVPKFSFTNKTKSVEALKTENLVESDPLNRRNIEIEKNILHELEEEEG